MEQLKKLAEKINSLSVRERAIVFIGIVFVIFTIWDRYLMSPLEVEQKQLIANLNQKNAERLTLVTQFQELMKTNSNDPDADNLATLQSLRSKLIDVQANLESSTQNLVTPGDMPKVLETVLYKTDGITLRNLKSLGVKPIVAKAEGDSDELVDVVDASDKTLTAENIDNAYRHGIRIEIEGDYFTTLEYLKNLEQLEWGFFWDNFSLSVQDYPVSNIAIEIFTLSLDEKWIGV